MANIDPDPAMAAARIAGALAGALVSLVYMMPKGVREAAARAIAGVVCGLVFGGPVGVALGQWMGVRGMLSPSESLLTGSAAASMSAWWALGALARIADRTGRGKDIPD
ncbi:DUF6107 family protein [Hoeflea sp. YIM 152468]|uniref:DUF6107 family protein n=1 Tax=Hoeflea sp. YIM 152468 TaxID=3031759 RepID=UPI0023DBD995|nr:DUF6107 family protein [Hoeflea sp. YIM 152468]MDF1607283.1 DUF6107 family protein [Hoeflea sp. YIM 152468]